MWKTVTVQDMFGPTHPNHEEEKQESERREESKEEGEEGNEEINFDEAEDD
ncbi:hypothetical protein J1N35_021972 [Gossypium stocksii]|uniref:Uncharacterized protein n=1 Tax=Gossypium stocksii TaxID=47602 RepID=A0A9D3VFI9_9ROSI|nr:hypothetical protein J1N35_021972 [Gossypium stocksii]